MILLIITIYMNCMFLIIACDRRMNDNIIYWQAKNY